VKIRRQDIALRWSAQFVKSRGYKDVAPPGQSRQNALLLHF